jgi:hypothetical protein
MEAVLAIVPWSLQEGLSVARLQSSAQ